MAANDPDAERPMPTSDATPDAAPNGSVTVWLAQLKGGDPEAVRPLWDAYFVRLVRLARERLRSAPRAAADEEDVALSAFDSFCRGAEAGRFPRLGDRDDLWQVLFVLITRKAIDLVRHATRAKRGGGRAVRLPGPGPDSQPGGPAVAAPDPPPEEVAEVTEQCARLLGLLDAGGLRQVAVWKMEGYANAEIAARLGRSVPAVERKLAAIRAIWEREGRR
jgi:DNA-directed RNA polymerase specialized sigma24 family protein